MTPPIVLAAGAVSAEELLRFWAALAVLLVTARGLGLLARRFGQAAVIGELSAGVLLGPTVLGRVAPDVTAWLFGGDAVSVMIAAIAWLGVVLLLAVTGFETDLGLLRRLGRAAAWTSAGSLVVPLAFGVALAFVLPDTFQGERGAGSFVLFMGVALAISALPVVAKVLRDMGVIGRPVGQITLAAGMVNDVVGWVLLGVVAGLANTGSFDLTTLAVALGGSLGFMALSLTVGQRGVDWLLRSVEQRDGSPSGTIGTAGIIVLVAGAVTQALGVEAVLGAFVAGIVLARSPLGGPRVERPLSAVADGLLAPVFFASAGLDVDLAVVFGGDLIGWTIAVIAVATAGKVLGGWGGARLGRLRHVEGFAIGVGLNARGALEIIIATVGLNLQVLSEAAYGVIVVMAVATSLMAPPLLSLVARRAPDGEDATAERLRIARERSRILAARSALLPTRGGHSSVMAARLLDDVLPPETRITALTVHPPELSPQAGRAAARVLDRLVRRRLTWRDRTGEATSAAILAEARLGYDVIAVGATDEGGRELLSPALAGVLAGSPVPVLLVKHGAIDPEVVDLPIRRVVAPVSGTSSARAARDVAAALAVRHSAELDYLHVLGVAGQTQDPSGDQRVRSAWERAEDLGRATREEAAGLGAEARWHVVAGSDLTTTLYRSAGELDADVIVVGTELRHGQHGAFLGATVERLLEESERTVVAVVLPQPN